MAGTNNRIPKAENLQDYKLKDDGKQTKHAFEENKNDRKNSDFQTLLSTRYLYKGFRFLGVLMPENYRKLYIIWSVVVNMAVTIYFPLGFVMSFMYLSGEELEIGSMLTSLQAAINVLGCSIKIVVMFFLLPKLLSSQPIIETLDKRCHSAEELVLIKQLNKKGNRFVVLFAMVFWCYSLSTCISAVIFKRLPYNIYNPFIDAKLSNVHFVLAVFVEMLLLAIACLQQVVDDSYAIIYVSILRTHLEFLLKRIKNLNSNALLTLENNFEELKLCIIDHKNIIKLYIIIAPIISITIFVQFTITATILGVTLINILIFATNFASIVASCFYVLVVIAEIFPMCYYAQCLMDESNSLADVIFHSNWVDQDPRYRKLLIFFIQRSQVTVTFTAGKIFPITLNSFLSIAKFSLSLYTFIKKMGIKERFDLE